MRSAGTGTTRVPADLVPGAPGGSDVARRHGGLTRAIKGEIGEQMKTVADLPVVDIDDEAFWQDVYPALHEARSISPVGVTPGGLLYVLGFDEVDGVLKDKRFGAFDQLALMGVTSGRVWEWWQRVMFSNNDPVHGRLRKLVNRAFTPPQIERKREVMGRIAEGVVADAVAKGSVDVMETMAHELPSRVMAALLAIPEVDREQFAGWTTDIGLAFGAATDLVVWRRVEDALLSLDDYVAALIEQRRGKAGDDLLSELIAAEESGDRLSTQELIDLVENLLFAGHDTTRGAAGVLLRMIAVHPEMLALARSDDGAVKVMVEEVLRYE